MSDLFGLLFDWSTMHVRIGLDGVLYAALALVGTTLFVIRFGMLALGFGDSDSGDDSGAEGAGEHDTGLPLFSLLSIMAFLMGAGWMGLTCRIDWEIGPTATAFIAAGFGVGLMLLASILLLGMRRLGRDVTYDVATAVGRVGTVYLSIPERGAGIGQIRINVSGRSMVLPAGSCGAAIEAFADVRVVDVRDDKVLLVERAERMLGSNPSEEKVG